MSNKALLIAIAVGLVVLCVVVALVANSIIRASENVEMAKDLVVYCSTSGKPVDDCQTWTTDVLQQHRDELRACLDRVHSYPGCVEELGLTP